MTDQVMHAHDHGHTLKHDHDDFGPHEHQFSHRHDHRHPQDGSSNDHETHEHLDLDGPVFAHRDHHAPPTQMTGPGEPSNDPMTGPGEPSDDPMTGPGGKSGKSRSLFWGESPE